MNDEVNKVCYKLDQSKQMVKLCDIPVDLKQRHSICETNVGFALTGGESSDLCMMFIASSKFWVRLQNMIRKRYSHGSICVRDVLYVIAGWESNNKAKSVHYLEIKRGSWQHGPDLPCVMVWPNVASVNDRIYVLNPETRQFWGLDFDRNMWVEKASFPTQCIGTRMASVNGQLLVAGGLERLCAWYTPGTNTWCQGQQPNVPHSYGSLAHCNDKILLLGGIDRDEVEELIIEDGSWSVTDINMPAKLYLHFALMLDIPQD